MMKIYLAGPYSHPDIEIRNYRFESLNKIAAHLMRQGHIVYSPISMSHPIAVNNDLPLDWQFWKKQDESFIDWCDLVYVAKLHGWDESKGVAAEIEIADKMGKDVLFYE